MMIDSDFGNSSFSTFMSGLLSECTERNELDRDELSIDIVDDQAKSESPASGGHKLRRSQSLVAMQRQKSSKQLSRWSSHGEYTRQDSEPKQVRRMPKGGSKNSNCLASFGGSAGGLGLLRKVPSDTMLLKPPRRQASPPQYPKTLVPAGLPITIHCPMDDLEG